MTILDWVVIAAYFGLLLGVTWWVILRRKETSDDYFLAGRGLGWFIVGASIFASNIGSEHLVGLAGSGTTDGVAMAHYELHAWCLLVLGWLMVPFYLRSRVFTMPEFLERRFSPTARVVLSLISLVAYVVTKIAVGIFAGGVVFSALLPEMHFGPLDSFWIGSIMVLVITGLYTTLGGFRAVAYTEAIQTIILVVGSVLVTVFGLKAIGGWHEMKAIAGSEMFNLWRPLVPAGVEGTWAPVEVIKAGTVVKQAWYFNGNYPWLGMLICAPIIGMWYWCTDQYIVQRTLGASSETEARRGTICAAFLKLLPVFIFIIPGVICFGLLVQAQTGKFKSEAFDKMLKTSAAEMRDAEGYAGKSIDPTTLTPQELDALREKTRAGIKDSGMAFPTMVTAVLPSGVRGIVVAGLLAALMSSLAGVFNACSTLFTIDFYRKFRPHASEHRIVRVGQIATAVMVLIGLLWIPVIRGSRGLYDYLQSVQGYLAPPIFVVFFLGIFWKRLNARGCLAALTVGFAMGIFRMLVDTPAKVNAGFEYASGSFLWIVNKIYFQYYSLIIFFVSAAVMILVSYASEQPDYQRISGLTFGTMTSEQRVKSRSTWGVGDVAASVLVIVLILCAYLYFRG